MYEIEKNIPLMGARKSVLKYPFQDMEIGDSFFIPKGATKHVSASVQSCIKAYNKYYNKDIKVVTRREETGVRVWRIE